MGAGKKFGVTTFAFGALVVGIATSSCGWLPKKVTEKDCNDWGDKFSKLTKDAFNENMKKCGKKALGSEGDKGKADDAKKAEKDAEKTADKAFSDLVDKQTKELVKGCITQTGKNYIAKDADCYMKASKMKEWGDCKFETPFFQDFATLGSTFDKQMQDSCQEGIDKAKGGGKDDDDDDDK